MKESFYLWARMTDPESAVAVLFLGYQYNANSEDNTVKDTERGTTQFATVKIELEILRKKTASAYRSCQGSYLFYKQKRKRLLPKITKILIN